VRTESKPLQCTHGRSPHCDVCKYVCEPLHQRSRIDRRTQKLFLKNFAAYEKRNSSSLCCTPGASVTCARPRGPAQAPSTPSARFSAFSAATLHVGVPRRASQLCTHGSSDLCTPRCEISAFARMPSSEYMGIEDDLASQTCKYAIKMLNSACTGPQMIRSSKRLKSTTKKTRGWLARHRDDSSETS